MQTKSTGKKHRAPQFNYDLERMKRQVASPSVRLPQDMTKQDDILRWMLAQ